MSGGKLVVVPTPVGNLGDMTQRAIDCLKEAHLVLAEDTRTTGKLLRHFGIDTPLRSFHQHNEHRALEGVVRELQGGITLALCSDAGTPGISDPGFLLVRACVGHPGRRQEGHLEADRAGMHADLHARGHAAPEVGEDGVLHPPPG